MIVSRRQLVRIAGAAGILLSSQRSRARPPEIDAGEAVRAICDTVGLPANFTLVRAPGIENAEAYVQGGQRYVRYDPGFISAIAQGFSRDWRATVILAHEVGHHLCGHTLDGIGSTPPKELEADHFAGFAVAKLGASLQSARGFFETLGDADSATHPGRPSRLQAVSAGWHRAGGTAQERHLVITGNDVGGHRMPVLVEFIREGTGWIERQPRAEFRFVERHRDATHIFLFDASREVWVSIQPNLRGGTAAGWWGTASAHLYPAQWVPLDPGAWR